MFIWTIDDAFALLLLICLALGLVVGAVLLAYFSVREWWAERWIDKNLPESRKARRPKDGRK